MLIVHGKKTTRTPAGWALLFCPICRDLRAFEAVEVRSVHHIYYASVGNGKVVAIELTCRECKVLIARKDGSLPLYHDSEIHAARTEAESSPRLVALRDQESAARAGRIPRPQRIELLAAPIVDLQYLSVLKFSTGIGQSISAILQLCLIVLMIATILSAASQQPPRDTAAWGIGTLAMLGIVLSRFWTQPRAIARRHILPFVVAALRPLRPTRDELEDGLNLARGRGAKIARHLSASQIELAISAADQPVALAHS